MSYTIVALPKDPYLIKLNTIKNYFYLNNFRYTIKTCQENAHITLLELDWDIPDTLEEDIKHLLKKEKINLIWDFSIVLQEHTWIYKFPEWANKYPKWCGRFTLFFPNNQQFIKIAQKIRKLTIKLGIDISLKYAQNIANAQDYPTENLNIFNYLANHMNICNYIRLEKMKEAESFFKEKFQYTKIPFDKIALVDNKQNILWSIYLSSETL